jgi:hypothetical protein
LKLHTVAASAAIGLAVLLSGCGKAENPQAYPLTHWLKDEQGCVRETAQAIVDSGRPWPNEIRDEKGYLKRIDFWVGKQLYEIPFNPAGPFGVDGLPKNYPLKYWITGHAESLIGVPRDQMLKFKHPGVGSTLYGDVRCYSHLPQREWVENTHANAATREQLLEQLMSERFVGQRALRRERAERTEIGMTELKQVMADPAEQPRAGASYVPLGRDIAQVVNGQRLLKGISCARAYDPDQPLSTAERCYVWVYLGPGLWVELSVYQQAMPVLPELHDQMVKMFETYRRN